MKADSAMYRAKESGGSKFAFFDDTLNEANRHRVLVETRLRTAIKQGLLEVHFQPKLNVKTWSVDSAEALMRWRDEQLGEVRPDMFVSIAEETSLIHDFMPILVDQAVGLIAAAEQAGTVLDCIAVNASPKQLMTDGFALSLLSLMDRHGLPHECLELEVTETVFARDTEQVVRELEILRTAGMKIALDDFGTGYSSFNMLRELPLDSLKIDRAFITELETSNEARVLVQHLISIASTLGMKVVAEGVETDVQLQHLLDTNCDYIQGFLISKALPKADFITTLLGWQSNARNRGPQAIDLSVSRSGH
jgi:EAL domain-containing protein (putative c-di-GMP-specific phosphodiesterase class I)